MSIVQKINWNIRKINLVLEKRRQTLQSMRAKMQQATIAPERKALLDKMYKNVLEQQKLLKGREKLRLHLRSMRDPTISEPDVIEATNVKKRSPFVMRIKQVNTVLEQKCKNLHKMRDRMRQEKCTSERKILVEKMYDLVLEKKKIEDLRDKLNFRLKAIQKDKIAEIAEISEPDVQETVDIKKDCATARRIEKINTILEQKCKDLDEMRERMRNEKCIPERQILLDKMYTLVLEKKKMENLRDQLNLLLVTNKNNEILDITTFKTHRPPDRDIIATQQNEIETARDAANCMQALQEYAMLQQNFRATGLLMQAEKALKNTNSYQEHDVTV
ncbi:uncharacterized protein LOC115622477 [Scaptodrosophila lebanonensis]|uniref:Uncharacterized protein LOC115622477 n=1 Tax=Drosophila lebanonensis TaxID=7225 RepID=A0A6J2T5T6_DROLE|nr:uncharacterized protein LOC115622477 [Scaptodrosophila lebanonensis]